MTHKPGREWPERDCAVPATAEDWSGYLDYAYVYVSAEPDALRARLAQYGKDAGIRLEDYTRKQFGPGAVDDGSDASSTYQCSFGA